MIVLLIVRITVLVGSFVVEVVVVVSSSKTVLVVFDVGGGFDVGSSVGSSVSDEVGGGVELVGGGVDDDVVVSFVGVADVEDGPVGVDDGGVAAGSSSLLPPASSCRLQRSLLFTSRGSSNPCACSARVNRTSMNAVRSKESHSVVDLILNILYRAPFL